MIVISIIVPSNLVIGGSAYIQNLIADTHRELNTMSETIEFDFLNTGFIAGEMTVLLGMLLKEVHRAGKKYKLSNISAQVSKALTRNNFLPYFQGGNSLIDSYNNTIQFHCGDARDDSSLNDYLNSQVFKNIHWNDVTNGQEEQEQISSAIHELAINVYQHSTVNEVMCCGQYYPNKHELSFALGDNGISIPNSIISSGKYNSNSDSDIINWATKKGTSTKEEAASGLGLYSVKNKLTSSGGLTIISRYGYWRQLPSSENNEIITFDLSNSPLRGTFIHFSLDTDTRVTNNVNNNDLQNLFF